MQRLSKRDYVRGLFLGIIFGVIVALSSCTSVRRPSTGYGLRLATGGGTSRVHGKDDVGQRMKADGANVGLRGEVTRDVPYLQNVEVGLRGGILGRTAETDNGFGSAHVEAGEFSLAPVIRARFPIADRVALYSEGFAGYAHDFGTLEVQSPILGTQRERGNGGGFMFGAGAGLELRTSGQDAFILGVEWSERSFGMKDLDFRTDDMGLFIGFRMSF